MWACPQDLAASVQETQQLDFLLDIVPIRKRAVTEVKPDINAGAASSSSAVDEDEPDAKRAKTEAETGPETDIWLPLSNVKKVMKEKLSDLAAGRCTCELDAYKAMVRGSTVFISYITACSQEVAKAGKRSTIGTREVLESMEEVDLQAFAPVLQVFITKHAEEKEREKAKRKGEKKAPTGFIKYSVENREAVKAELDAKDQSVATGDVAKELGRRWKALSAGEKEVYFKAEPVDPEKLSDDAAALIAAAQEEVAVDAGAD